MKKILVAAFFTIFVSACTTGTPPSTGQNTGLLDFDEFYDEMLAHVAEFNIKEDNIDRVTFVEIVNGGRRGIGRVASIEYWLRLDSCNGVVVIEVNSAGKVINSYSRGDCEFEGMRRFR